MVVARFRFFLFLSLNNNILFLRVSLVLTLFLEFFSRDIIWRRCFAGVEEDTWLCDTMVARAPIHMYTRSKLWSRARKGGRPLTRQGECTEFERSMHRILPQSHPSSPTSRRIPAKPRGSTGVAGLVRASVIPARAR